MKVKCIDNRGYLTIGKTYDVIEEKIGYYRIINDNGDKLWYRKEWSKPAVAEIRNETINKLLSDEVIE